MNEEKEKAEEKIPEAAAPQPELPKKDPEVKETSAKKEEGKLESPSRSKGEKPKNCVQCNKPIKRKTWYYRNGKYFCGKGCWKLSQKVAA